jgi:predicted Fe-Mo cluster-binding NifX family protein
MLALGVCLSSVFAQRGAGDLEGVARQPAKPKLVSLSGKVLEVKTEPCEMTTGPSELGTHLMMKTSKGKTLNIHLGPADAVKSIARELTPGMDVKIQAFRTEKTKEGQYIARSLTIGDRTTELRDQNLRPMWAGRGVIKTRPGKIAVTVVEPSLDAEVDPRFGRCPYFILVDSESESFESLKNTNTNQGDAGIHSAKMIAAKGVKVLLTGKCGSKATDALATAGIQVVSGCSGTARETIAKYKAGRSQPVGEPSVRPRSGAGRGRGRGRGQRGRNRP